jgi:hypothetical protein
VAVGLTSQEIIIKWPQFEALATSALLAPAAAAAGADGLSSPFPPDLLASPKHNRLLPQPTTLSRLPCQIAELIRPCKNPSFFRQDPPGCCCCCCFCYISEAKIVAAACDGCLDLRACDEVRLRRRPGLHGDWCLDGGRWRVGEEVRRRRRRRKMRAGRCRALGLLSTPCTSFRWFLPVSACFVVVSPARAWVHHHDDPWLVLTAG